ncbi:MAG: hypothetical protein HY860_02750 [Chlamydiales bacterium]|nr:hypothetical protein [Chlamydiales bacterium]
MEAARIYTYFGLMQIFSHLRVRIGWETMPFGMDVDRHQRLFERLAVRVAGVATDMLDVNHPALVEEARNTFTEARAILTGYSTYSGIIARVLACCYTADRDTRQAYLRLQQETVNLTARLARLPGS